MEKEKTEDQINVEKKDGSMEEEKIESELETKQENENKEEQTPEAKVSELEEKLVRLYAEMENQRRRYEKEREDAFEYGGFSLAKETLNLIDNLERSKITIEKDESIKNSDALKKIINHLDIIYKDMMTILKKNNISPIDSVGKKLDPNLHQAMMEIEDENKDSGIIIQEIQKGFMMKNRLLRPSLVAVSKNVEKKEQNLRENKEKNDEKK
jgi:molecular chaperone GrpE